MEVEVGRAARAAADDKAAAEQRIATRRRRRRIGALAVVAALLLAGGAVAIDRIWFGPPSLAPGARHTATLRLAPGCPGQLLPELDFAGHHWWPQWNSLTTEAPVTGTLVIVRRADNSPIPDATRTTAELLVGEVSIDLYGGGRGYRGMECPMS